MITRIRVKSSHIEFQLDGGGYGTMGDETSSSVYVESTPKSNREKNLEAELKREKDPERRDELKDELDDLKDEREREDARNRTEATSAAQQKEQNIRQRRLEGGSRFNVRFREAVPRCRYGGLDSGRKASAKGDDGYRAGGDVRPAHADLRALRGLPPRRHPHLPVRRRPGHRGVCRGRALPLLHDLGVRRSVDRN
jgi:hypothetical protein